MQPTQNPATSGRTPTTTPAGVLRYAAWYLAEYGWYQGDLYDNPDAFRPAACALGGLRMAVFGAPAERLDLGVWTPEEVDLFGRSVSALADFLVLSQLVPAPEVADILAEGDDLSMVVADWNDNADQTAEQVQAALDEAASQWERLHRSHVDYPHEPGRPYDCPACQAQCFCTPDTTMCVHCATERESLPTTGGDA